MQKGENRERALIEAALQLFRTKGYSATSIRDLADAIGVQKSALYHYVGSKEDLLYRISYETLEQSLSEMREILNAPVSAVEQLRRAIDHHVQYVALRGAATTIFLRDIFALEEANREVILTLAREYEMIWHQILQTGIERGEFRTVDVKMTVMAILGAGNWVATWFTQQGRLSSEEVSDIFFHIFLAGLVGRGDLGGAEMPADPPGISAPIFQHEVVARWADVDGSGTVPVACLIRWCEETTDALLESRSAGRPRLQAEAGVTLLLVRGTAEIHHPIRPGDALVISLTAGQATERTITAHAAVHNAGRLVARAELTYEAREPRCEVSVPLPASVRSLGHGTDR